MDRFWVKQLYKEYDHICFQYRAPLKGAVLRIQSPEASWGNWCSNTRTITIARHLVTEYPWCQVIEVLKHEMAHQWVWEVDGLEEHHGRAFKNACERLGLRGSAASSCFGPQKEHRVSPKEERLIRITKKLLRLANSANEHEALAAIEKVRQLHQTYHIDALMEEETSDFATAWITHNKKRFEGYQSKIASILDEHFGVKVIHADLYLAQENHEVKAVEILGRRHNVRLAEYVYWFLHRQIKWLWQDYARTRGKKGMRERNSYYCGVLEGFVQSLRKKNKDCNPTTHKALITREHQALGNFVSFIYPRIHRVSSYTRCKNAQTYEDGTTQGKNLKLHLPLETNTRQKSATRLLTSTLVSN